MTAHLGDGFYKELVDNMSDGVYFVDRARRITYWSQGAERLTGYRADDVVEHRCRDNILNHMDEDGKELCISRCPLQHTMFDGLPREARVWMRHADGHRQPVYVRSAPIRDNSGKIVGAVELFSDDSAVVAAKERVAELEPLAMTDSLTGLGNRRHLDDHLGVKLDEWTRHGWPFAVIMADIDHFKQVNDEFGHAVGDDALKMVARSLAFGSRSSDPVFRLGGEEFVMVLAHCDHAELAKVAERLRSLVASSRLVVARQQVSLTISIGGTLACPGDDVASILRRADCLLYEAKTTGRNRVVIDDAVM